ncbi:MAG: methylmalonyl-CoA carboxytransferase subunit 5S [Proteobacteria bacterium]|nr:methylmalonyl-CoA carboxytransferase subunit 5S [Pseudomonadota bacterium]
MNKLIHVTELALRDAHQSLMATRLAMEDMVPVCEDLDNAGFWSLECWGGATFDACIRFLNEDPWERLRSFKKLLPKTPLQMLLRGQNLLGYRHYEDSVVSRFVERAAANGMDVFRVFDALNDARNLEVAIKAVKRSGKHAQGTICYTISPVHTVQGYVELAQKLIEMGADSICLKDMAALLKPQPAYDIVKAIKERCGREVRIHVHTHATTGVTLVSLMKAVEAGADMVDTAVSSVSLGPGHNPTESFVEMLEGTGYTTQVDLARVAKVRNHMAQIRPRYAEFLSNITGVDTEIFKSQIPGGMISNMESQLRQQDAADRLQEVLEEVPRARKVSGYPPLVTPTSQIVGTQAVFNVLMGPYQAMTGEFADLMLGYYGTTAAPKDPEVLQRAEQHAKKAAITCRPADLLKPEWEALQRAANALPGANGSDEDVLTFAMFPQVAPKFFASRAEGPKNVGKKPATSPPTGASAGAGAPAAVPLAAAVNYSVTIHGRTHKVTVSPS